MCVGEETSKGAHVCSNHAEIDDSLHPWPLLPIKWQFIVQAMWQNQFPFWQLIEIDRLIKQRKRGEQLRRTKRKRTWRRTKVAANTCDALHKQNHCLINSYFLIFPHFHSNHFAGWSHFEFQPKILETSLQAITDSSFSAFAYWQGKSESAVIWEVDLAWQFNINSSERHYFYGWFGFGSESWQKNKKNDLLSFVTAKGLRAPWGGEFPEPASR